MEKQATNLEKIIENSVSDKGLLPRIYKEYLRLNNKIRRFNFKNRPKV